MMVIAPVWMEAAVIISALIGLASIGVLGVGVYDNELISGFSNGREREVIVSERFEARVATARDEVSSLECQVRDDDERPVELERLTIEEENPNKPPKDVAVFQIIDEAGWHRYFISCTSQGEDSRFSVTQSPRTGPIGEVVLGYAMITGMAFISIVMPVIIFFRGVTLFVVGVRLKMQNAKRSKGNKAFRD